MVMIPIEDEEQEQESERGEEEEEEQQQQQFILDIVHECLCGFSQITPTYRHLIALIVVRGALSLSL